MPRILHSNLLVGFDPQHIAYASKAEEVCVAMFYSGLQAEGLLHCQPGPSDTHSGGFLENGVGMEMSLHCDAHGAPGEGAGKPWTADGHEPAVSHS